ncbi:hypothetical protein [Corynebacterium riegelii]|uniref:hypothetical protein n=1 Tax=Corynebacterium riegelii TaxID=156976 RepID=UPI002889E459|nr:hypothetical protein [Corynebacterium riegelii]
MDNQTRQFGAGDSGEQHPGRPQQYFPDQSSQYGGGYSEPYYGGPDYNQPDYNQPDYGVSSYDAPQKGTNTAALALGLLAAILAVAAVVLFFLWRASAQEANKPPVTVTETSTATTTVTTTRKPFDFGFGERDNANPDEEPAPVVPTEVLPTDVPLPDINFEELFNKLDELSRG